MKDVYLVNFYGKVVAAFESESEAEEMVLELINEEKYETFIKEINRKQNFEEITEYAIEKYGNKEEYEKSVERWAWYSVKCIEKFSEELIKITKIAIF